MSSIIFDSFKSLYNYYYDVGKDWTSPNQAMPEKKYSCWIKTQKKNDDPECIKGFFSDRGWVDFRGNRIEEGWNLTVIEWKYDTSTKSNCAIL
jgi:hypothetical protein